MLAVVGAHPDDAELGAGGLLFLKQGLIVCLTDGSNHTRTPSLAKLEQRASAGILGCEYVMCDHDTVTVSQDVVGELDAIFAEYDIDTVVTHCPEDTNQEHALCSQLAIAASRRIDNVLFFEPIPPSGRCGFAPNVYVDISGVAAQKYDAVGQYRSQVNRMRRSLTETRRALDRWRGMEMTPPREYAEALRALRLSL